MEFIYSINQQKFVKDIDCLEDLLLIANQQAVFDPPLDVQLAKQFDNFKTKAIDPFAKQLIISCSTDDVISNGVIKSLNDLSYVALKVKDTPKCSFYPPLEVQLQSGGGWDDEQISKYQAFVKEVQDSLPKHYKFDMIDSKLDEYINFWNFEASSADVNKETILEQLIELKKIVF